MKVSAYKALAPEGSPALPDELGDDDRLEDYLLSVFFHATRKGSSDIFSVSISPGGDIVAEMKVKVDFTAIVA